MTAVAVAQYRSHNFFIDCVPLQFENSPSPVRNGAVAKGSHDAERLRGVMPIGQKWLSLNEF